MKTGAFLLVLSLLLILQVSPLLPFADYGIRPDLLLLLTVFFGVRLPAASGAFGAFALGCLIEVFSGMNTGLYPLVYLAVFFSIRAFERLFDFSRAANLFLLTAASLIIKFVILQFCFSYVYEFRHFAIQEPFLKESAYTLLALPLVFALLLPLHKKPKEDLLLKEVVLLHEHRNR